MYDKKKNLYSDVSGASINEEELISVFISPVKRKIFNLDLEVKTAFFEWIIATQESNLDERSKRMEILLSSRQKWPKGKYKLDLLNAISQIDGLRSKSKSKKFFACSFQTVF